MAWQTCAQSFLQAPTIATPGGGADDVLNYKSFHALSLKHLPAQNVGMETAQSPTDAGPSGFPQSPSEFDADPRIAFSRVDEKFLLETEEGTEFEWDNALRRWIPVVGIVPLSHHHHHEEAVPPLRTRS